jgi:integrase
VRRDFDGESRQRTGLAVNALMLAILAVARTNEIINMQWDEVNLDARVFTVPAERMKMASSMTCRFLTRRSISCASN